MYRQEEDEQAEAEAAGTGEDLCHPSAYNKETASAVSLINSWKVTDKGIHGH